VSLDFTCTLVLAYLLAQLATLALRLVFAQPACHTVGAA